MYWWVSHDFIQYTGPVAFGEVMTSRDYFPPGFTPTNSQLKLGFIESVRQRADFSNLDDSLFFVNGRALHAFRDLFISSGRVFEIAQPEGLDHYLILIDRVFDAFDWQSSEYEAAGSPPNIMHGISRIRRVVLKEGFRTTFDIFRLGHFFPLLGVLIVSDRLKKIYEDNHFTGLCFAPAEIGVLPEA